MEWFGGGVLRPEQEREENTPCAHPHEPSAESMASLCLSQQRCVKASIASQWQLVEAQDQLCGLELHSSESVEQERARALASSAELSQTEQEWRHKERMLGRSPTLCPEASRDVFDKSIINSSQSWPNESDHDKNISFIQHNEELLKHFGMLRRWDDSQRFLAEYHHLICEETANYLILWCFRLQAVQKEALMEQVAHQAVVMQFILEMARNSQQDPRGCFRQFFQKAKAGQEGYLDVFHTELNDFKQRVKVYTMKSKGETPKDPVHQNTPPGCRLDPKEVLESLPPVAEYHVKRCLEAGLWTNTPRASKEESSETDEWRMMES
ncbi:hsp90 co-chaperone Cdc37-like 1 isoform X2 [Sinocyclocheilus rhinocerous]|uniref:Hsp90 co-chaperone Cdc37-like 1 n=1 Tax=Sinocyclocheilus rhinocerous TaxID=307959 RepID=A0A673MQI4_9TELE|nr:PREDICTED: hsp90 co-chaperone Cdc37-like 1 isoform X2 [Sinocyclocheilus rhinocerous]